MGLRNVINPWYSTIVGFQVSIDAAGRIVIPKPLRQLLRLHQGTTLNLEVQDDRLVLSAARPAEGCLGYADGTLIVTGELVEDMPGVEDVRRDRIAHILGQ